MNTNQHKLSIPSILLHAGISLGIICVGIYVLLEKKMIISGKYHGGLYELDSPGYIIMAVSLFMLAAFFLLALIQTKTMKLVCQWLFGLSLLLFGVSMFV